MEGKFDVFISYSRSDKDNVAKLHKNLVQKYGYKVWIDLEQVHGSSLQRVLHQGIINSKVFICCMSNAYVSSENCNLELNYAYQSGKQIIYLKLQEKVYLHSWMNFVLSRHVFVHCYKDEDNWGNNQKYLEEIRRNIETQ